MDLLWGHTHKIREAEYPQHNYMHTVAWIEEARISPNIDQTLQMELTVEVYPGIVEATHVHWVGLP